MTHYNCCSKVFSNLIHSCNKTGLTLLVIRSVSDVLWAKSRLVKFVGGEAAGQTPYTFNYNLLWARSTSETDLITNLLHHQPLISR